MASTIPSEPRRVPPSNLGFLTVYLAILSALALPDATSAADVLIYSATRAFRHDSIPTAIEALKSRSASYNITFDNTEDLTWFRDDRLGKYDAILFLSTTGDGELLKSRPV